LGNHHQEQEHRDCDNRQDDDHLDRRQAGSSQCRKAQATVLPVPFSTEVVR
jgi:hypothetical protein